MKNNALTASAVTKSTARTRPNAVVKSAMNRVYRQIALFTSLEQVGFLLSDHFLRLEVDF